MKRIERYQPLILLGAMFLGLLLGRSRAVADGAAYLVEPFLILMLYGLFLSVPLKGLRAGFKSQVFALSSLSINFIWTPILAWCLGMVFLPDHPALRLGFLMLMVTPCTDWYLAFTAQAKGNLSLATAILPVNLVMQVLLLPSYLFLFGGIWGGFDWGLLLKSVLVVLVLPFGAAVLSRRLSLLEKYPTYGNFFQGGQPVFLSLAVMAMFASQGAAILDNPKILLALLAPLFLFFVVNFFLARLAAGLLKFGYKDYVALGMTTMARNSPLALAIAIVAFPDDPMVSLALIIGPLLELPILALAAQAMLILGKPGQKTPKAK